MDLYGIDVDKDLENSAQYLCGRCYTNLYRNKLTADPENVIKYDNLDTDEAQANKGKCEKPEAVDDDLHESREYEAVDDD